MGSNVTKPALHLLEPSIAIQGKELLDGSAPTIVVQVSHTEAPFLGSMFMDANPSLVRVFIRSLDPKTYFARNVEIPK